MTFTDARNNLAAAMDRASLDHEPVIIIRRNGAAAVLMSLEDFQSWQETAYLLSSPANARALNCSMDEVRTGAVRSVSDEEWNTLRELN